MFLINLPCGMWNSKIYILYTLCTLFLEATLHPRLHRLTLRVIIQIGHWELIVVPKITVRRS